MAATQDRWQPTISPLDQRRKGSNQGSGRPDCRRSSEAAEALLRIKIPQPIAVQSSDDEIGGWKYNVAPGTQTVAASLLMVALIVTRTMQVLQFLGIRGLHSLAIAWCRPRLRHRRCQEHNCDQNGQQSSSANSDNLADGDHVRARTFPSIQSQCRGVARISLTLIKYKRRSPARFYLRMVGQDLEGDLRTYGDKHAGVPERDETGCPRFFTAALITAVSQATGTITPPNDTERQRGMKAMVEAAKSINAMCKGTSPYDATAFKGAAETRAAWTTCAGYSLMLRPARREMTRTQSASYSPSGSVPNSDLPPRVRRTPCHHISLSVPSWLC